MRQIEVAGLMIAMNKFERHKRPHLYISVHKWRGALTDLLAKVESSALGLRIFGYEPCCA